MATNFSAMNVQITFLPGTYSLVHFPHELYPHFLHSVLRVLFPQTQVSPSQDWPRHSLPGLTAENQHTFLNVSVTPLECSIVCHSSWAQSVFQPAVREAAAALASSSSSSSTSKPFVSQDSYLVLSVISSDIDVVGRIVELTSPLALAGIPIFFLSTYYSDFILVPAKDRDTVVNTLRQRGFALHRYEKDSFVTGHHGFADPATSTFPDPASPAGAEQPPPSPTAVSELFDRTFSQLKKRNVGPVVDEDLRLVQLSARDIPYGLSSISSVSDRQRPSFSRQNTNNTTTTTNGRRRDTDPEPQSWLDTADTTLYSSLVSALITRPRFFSLTLAVDDPPSVLLDRALLPLFGASLVGDKAVELVPISLDLRSLPFEVTGIVCGVAGKLVREMTMAKPGLSYLSTASAGTVVLSPEQSVQALDILRPLMATENSA